MRFPLYGCFELKSIIFGNFMNVHILLIFVLFLEILGWLVGNGIQRFLANTKPPCVAFAKGKEIIECFSSYAVIRIYWVGR